MKAFIYDKKESKLFRVIANVSSVIEDGKKIVIHYGEDEEIEVEKKIYKTTVYQN